MVLSDRHGRYLREWNPLIQWQFGETRLKAIVEEECQKINSMSQVKFFKYVKTVTTTIIGPITFRVWQALVWREMHFIDPEVLVNTVKAILDCIQSRLEGKSH